jgi:hypothetical protein
LSSLVFYTIFQHNESNIHRLDFFLLFTSEHTDYSGKASL